MRSVYRVKWVCLKLLIWYVFLCKGETMQSIYSRGDLMSRVVIVLEVMVFFGTFRYFISCNIGVYLIACQCSSLIFITSWDWLCAPLFWVKIMILVDEIHLCLPHECLNSIHQRKLHHPLHLCALEVQLLQTRNSQTHHFMKVYFSSK